jgi:hypothetical protein
MPDISMCNNKKCRKFLSCYRAQAVPSVIHQSYNDFHEDTDSQMCEMFMEIWTNKGRKDVKCDYVKEGSSCSLNNNCTYPDCKKREKELVPIEK